MRAHHRDKDLTIKFDIEILATPEQVWAQLATPEGMQKWLSQNLIFEMEVGGQFRMEVNTRDGHWIFFGTVQKIIPKQELTFSWTQQEVGKEAWPIATLVTFKLKEIPKGTLVSLTHSGFDALDEAIAEKEYKGHIEGWERSASLIDLKDVVEGAKGQ